jgi:hypothetical protein
MTACLAVAGLSVASAARLDVGSASVSVAQARPCTTAIVQATRTKPVLWGLGGYEAVSLAIPAECQGSDRVVDVTVFRTLDGAAVARATTTGLTATTALDMSATYGWIFSSHTIAITIDGWSVPARF